jgi:arylsulfatase
MTGYPELYAQGWDKIRDQRLARQKNLGLLSEGTSLTPRSQIPKPAISKRMGSLTDDGKNPGWDALPAERRADLAQRMSVYAGMITGMDRNIGRLVAELRASGQLDNTLLLFLSDNGACAEWEPFGFEMQPTADPQPGTGINQGTQALPNKLYRGDELQHLGGPGSRPSYGSGWANASNTPGRMYKHYDHEGGISSPFIVHWPSGIPARGGFRAQVGHLIDIMATCIDVSGARYPAEWDGSKTLPPEGLSLVPAFTDRPLDREYLAWEHEGNRAIREGHWKLVSLVGAPWELYDMDTDRVELRDLAAREPERVKEMSAKWDAWAVRTHVLPRPGEPKKPSVD